MDLSQAPKQYADNISIANNKEVFVMAVLSGSTGTAYTLSLQHMKRLAQYATHTVAEFEKINGKINAEWTPGVQSPIQFQDLKNMDNK